jgi:NhaP-type Na+/H+ or K+/H+ antiporter
MASTAVSPKADKTSLLFQLSIWTVFLAGLFLQFFSPHLQVAHDSFVIPPALMAQGLPIDPRALIRQERMIQLCSAFLVLVGAIGLALYYRRSLFRYLSGSGE